MSEPGEITNVVDAFDEENGDPFDVHISLGFQYSSLSSKILRESFLDQPGLSSGRFVSPRMNVANYTETTTRLNTRIDVGVYKDIGLYLRMPLILSNNRELSDLAGSSRSPAGTLGAPTKDSATGYEKLFSLPFKSPTRSGIEYLAVGFDFGIFNQARDPSKPTWIFGAEGRFNVSEPMHACGPTKGVNLQGDSQLDCADPADINRNGKADAVDPLTGQQLDGSVGKRSPGVSRGTTALQIHSIMSRRVKYVEPYGGFRALIEFANKSSDFGRTDLNAVLTSSPPVQGWMIMGMMFHPYENREQFQRLTFDLRFTGAYRSQGRDYSPLFDAIGSSDAPSIRRPNFSDYRAPQAGEGAVVGSGSRSVVNQGSQKVYVTGLTDTAAHGSFQVSASAQFQAAEFIKFQLGFGYTYIQSHYITGDQPCNPNFKNDVSKSGPCQSTRTNGTTTTASATGVPNPLYRPAIDIVGRRFLMDSASQIDVWANAVVMF